MNAVVFAPEAPYPVVGGGPMRTASVLEYLRNRYNVEVITCREPGAPDPTTGFPEDIRVRVLDLPFHSKSFAARGLRNLDRYVRGVPPLIDRFSGFSSHVREIVNGRNFALGIIEHFWCAPYAEILRPVCDRLILNLHNIESVLLDACGMDGSAALSNYMFRRWASRCRVLESRWLPVFDLILASSGADAARLPTRAVIYPNAIPYVPAPKDVRKRDEIVFSGNLEYQPNYSAVRWFAREIWPGLRHRCPSLVWKLAGKNEHAIRRLVQNDDRILTTGPIEDAICTLAESALSIVPLLAGSGTRIKIIEAWAAGLPVVSTTIGAEGLPAIPGTHLLIADSAADFGSAIVKVLQSSTLACELGQAGRRLYEERLTWEAAWKVLNQTGL